MKIAFIDPVRAYSADAPTQGPLGGTQSAVCYLAQALVASGHTATLYNHIVQPQSVRGVDAKNWASIFDDAVTFDALVLVGRWTRDIVAELANLGRPLIGWMHEAAFNADNIVPHPSFTAMVFVSDWQRRVNAAELPANVQGHVIQNAISPFVETLTRDADLMINKNPHRAIFAGDALRGLIPLVEIWPQLHALDPRLTLEIYSDPELQGTSPSIAAAFRARLSSLPGLAHAGKVGQAELATAMAGASWHLSPNPYPETSCITLLEALALGCRSIITARAALPESAHGFATLVPVIDADNHRTNVVPINSAAFIAAFVKQLTTSHDAAAQRDYLLAHHTWAHQAQRWVHLVETLKS